MRLSRRQAPSAARWALLVVVVATLGCRPIGPKTICAGRMAYTETIALTDKQQTLKTIVDQRYGEFGATLSISSVTASLRFSGKAAADVGYGPSANYSGNLVPLTLGVAYEENPTISYVPVRGDEYLRSFLAPIPLELVILLVNAAEDPGKMLNLLARRANQLANPAFLRAPDASDGAWHRFTTLVDELAHRNVVRFAEVKGRPAESALILHGHQPQYVAKVQELLRLLGVPESLAVPDPTALPIALRQGKDEPIALVLETRSYAELLRIAAASVEVPASDIAAGFAESFPPLGSPGDGLRIRRASERPATAMVAIRRGCHWYYIDGRDQRTKKFFRLLQVLEHQLLALAEDPKSAPVLTVPVGG